VSGQPLVLIHGGAGTPLQWRPVMPLLAPHHELLAVTLVGHHGGRPAPPGPATSIDVLVDGVEADMDAAGWATAHVAGTSLGSWVALELAKRGRARTCTALAPAGWSADHDLGVRLVTRLYRAAVVATRLMARDPARWTRRPGVRRLLYWHHFARTDRMDPTETAHMLVGVANCTVLPSLFAWAAEHGGPAGLDRIECPVQLVFAERDRVLPRRRFGEPLIAALPSARVRELPGAGHVATWDTPELVAQAILDFTR
jgi:pimeloyl-ACP methyl ester carboxylesterase